jgi:hypothetical protein
MEEITRLRRSSASTDSFGEPVYTTVSTIVMGMVSARVSSTNFDPAQVTVSDGLTVYFATGFDIEDDDKFTVRGKTYELDGEAFDWRAGLGSWTPGTVVNLQREADRG